MSYEHAGSKMLAYRVITVQSFPAVEEEFYDNSKNRLIRKIFSFQHQQIRTVLERFLMNCPISHNRRSTVALEKCVFDFTFIRHFLFVLIPGTYLESLYRPFRYTLYICFLCVTQLPMCITQIKS